MKKGLLVTTALIGAGALMGGAAGAAEAPEYSLGGNMNFQFYYMDADITVDQDHGWYFGVDEAELALKADGAADNGLKYGFKIELNVNTGDREEGENADEARIQLSGDWGTLQLGDEDGAEDIMNYGGDNVMGGTGGYDGDFGDLGIIRGGDAANGPGSAGDSGDATKLSYFSPRFTGFQVGISVTPNVGLSGDEKKLDSAGDHEDHYGFGLNYDNAFGDLRVQVSAVYATAAAVVPANFEDIDAWAVGTQIGFGAFTVGANYTDDMDSGIKLADFAVGDETTRWDVAASFSTGPFTVAVGYYSGTLEFADGSPDDEFTNFAVTADYVVAPGLKAYADVTLIDDTDGGTPLNDQSATVVILGVAASF